MKKTTKKPKPKTKPEDRTGKGGGQYNNKNAEKWNEEEALKLGNELIEWISEEPTMASSMHGQYIKDINMFVVGFTASKKLCRNLPSELAKKFKSFSALLKIAQGIQEDKILKYSMLNKTNSAISIFCLKNHHGYVDKQDLTINKLEAAKKFKFGW